MPRIDTVKLLRMPFLKAEKQLYLGDTKYIDSPNNNQYLTLSHFSEPHMGVTVCLFNLIDRQNEIIEKFEPLIALGLGNDVHWSYDSKYFSTPLFSDTDKYFIYDSINEKFTMILVKNIWVLNSRLTENNFEIKYRDDQMPDIKENVNFPTKDYTKPDDFIVDLSSLKWFNKSEIKRNYQYYKDFLQVNLTPIDNEFRKFYGCLPVSTDRTISDIERFAEYGDEQSQEWLNEIKLYTNDKYYSWKNASEYIGMKKRNTAGNTRYKILGLK